ncbi:MAG: hypothetical protein FWD51_03890 [Betaproteobacteria bacterium]|nr:hypothetical protein [Betaproteobacteria bacterium]
MRVQHEPSDITTIVDAKRLQPQGDVRALAWCPFRFRFAGSAGFDRLRFFLAFRRVAAVENLSSDV